VGVHVSKTTQEAVFVSSSAGQRGSVLTVVTTDQPPVYY